MLTDLADIGVVYDDILRAADNTAAITAFLTASGTDDIALSVTGPLHGNGGRQPGICYLQGGTAPIFDIANRQFTLLGLGGSQFNVSGAPAGNETVPLIRCRNSVAEYTQILRDFQITTDQSGIEFTRVGTQGQIHGVVIVGTGTTGNALYDSFGDIDFTDIINPVLDCTYGIWLNDMDGGSLHDVRVRDAGDHGIVITRWHDGSCMIGQVHKADKIGIKGERINGCHLDLRCESCGGYGTYFELCGTGHSRTGARTAGGRIGATTRIHSWHEANNGRDAGVSPSTVRQTKIDRCDGMLWSGQSGFSHTLMNISPACRQLNLIREALYLNQSGTLLFDLDDLTDLTDAWDNFSTAWQTSPTHRPTYLLAPDGDGGNQIEISIPAGCYDNADGQGFLRPFDYSPVNANEGDVITQSVEIRVDQPLVDYCKLCEPEGESTAYFMSILGKISLEQHQSLVPNSERWTGDVYFTGFDTSSRMLYSKIYRQSTTSSGETGPTMMIYTSGMGGPSGDQPAATGKITIVNWKVWRVSN